MEAAHHRHCEEDARTTRQSRDGYPISSAASIDSEEISPAEATMSLKKMAAASVLSDEALRGIAPNMTMRKGGCVYIVASKNRRVLYTGVTAYLKERISGHRSRSGSKFAARYRATRLVYIEYFDNIEDAIRREKQIKAGSRAKKIALIEELNPHWEDLAEKPDFLL